ncbi:MAG: hypothetical protein IKB79_01730 [Oscillospiraceae bacterium]|nr:hypothetical protein [Oscillospiraceae bacterium]
MADFAVLERGEALARQLVARFGPAVGTGGCPGLLVVGPEVTEVSGPLTCGTVLLPGSQSRLLEQISAKSAVSYGMSGRDTITLSSRRGNRLWVAVQRELVRLDGTVLERQELWVETDEGMDTLHALALTGARLLLE